MRESNLCLERGELGSIGKTCAKSCASGAQLSKSVDLFPIASYIDAILLHNPQ